MVDKRKRLSGKLARNAALPRHALLIHAFKLIVALYKKTQHDKLAHFKKWEREKIVNLGLADYPLPLTHSPSKDITLTSWHREKIANFGLTASHAAKSSPPIVHQPKENHSDSDAKFTPKISPVQTWKKDQNQTGFKSDNSIDDFFKILGYE